LYYGEEIGMQNNDPKSKEEVRDPQGKIGWPTEKGRDGERTPMQWTSGSNGGFTRGKPWLPVPPSTATHNVASESTDPDSILNFYKRLLFLRHHEKALLNGEYIPLDESNPNVLSFLRRSPGEAVLVVLNMSGTDQEVVFDLAPYGLTATKREILLTSGHTASHRGVINLDPYTAYFEKLTN
jgi:alpha-glucosidase